MSARRTLGLGLAFGAALLQPSCGQDECRPADFNGGFACGPEDGQFQSCQMVDCSGSCATHWVIDVQYCPSSAPNCVQLERGQALCLGTVLGPCLTQGFVRCEDLMTEISCVPDGHGGLVLTRGTCAVGARCIDRHDNPLTNLLGCDPDY